MEFFGKHRLVPHPDIGPKGVGSVEVEVVMGNEAVLLRYAVEPAGTLLLPTHGRERRDNLWQGTCFELFVNPDSRGYVEFNFAPLMAWNAYSFVDWRMGRRPYQPDVEPRIQDSRTDSRKENLPDRYELDAIIGADLLTLGPAGVSLAAIIQEEDGTMSYWALAHPPGEPNFHHADCFVARLP
jgi:hypothetical protein